MGIDMVQDSNPRVQYTAAAGQTLFPYPFPIWSEDDLKVDVDGTLQVDGYSVDGVQEDQGGFVTFDSAPGAGAIVTIYADSAFERLTDFPPTGRFSSTALNDEFDRLTILMQQLRRDIKRCLRYGITDQLDDTDGVLELADRAGRYLAFDANGNPEFATALVGSAVLSPSTIEANLTREVVGNFIYPVIPAETNAGVTVIDKGYEWFDPRRYYDEENHDDHTIAVQAAIDAASATHLLAVTVPIYEMFTVNTLTIDAKGLHIRGHGRGTGFTATDDIPTNGAIILSLAGGTDATVNQALLDGIYGTDAPQCRTNVSGSLEGVVLSGLHLVPNTAADIRGIWMTGFTRGCEIRNCIIEGFKDHCIALNGSWSFVLANNRCTGADSTGTCIGLGQTGMGERDGSAVCNAVTVVGGTCSAANHGFIHNFGTNLNVLGLTCEGNAGDGFRSFSVAGAKISGYFELNGTCNMRLGGTNGTDFAEDFDVKGCLFNNTSTGGANIIVQSAKRCEIGPNTFTGSRTQWYQFPTGAGARITDCTFYVPDVTSTYMTQVGEFDNTTNDVKYTGGTYKRSIPALTVTSAFALSGSAKGSAITDAKTDYTTGDLDTEAEIIAALNTTNGKINAILTRLRDGKPHIAT